MNEGQPLLFLAPDKNDEGDEKHGNYNHNHNNYDQKHETRSKQYQILKIFCLCFSSFGCHFSRHALTILGIYLLEDRIISLYGIGILFALLSIPAMFLPLIIGEMIDSTKHIFRIGTGLLMLSIVAESILTIGLIFRSFMLIAFSQLLFGCCSTSFTAIQRIMITYFVQVTLPILVESGMTVI